MTDASEAPRRVLALSALWLLLATVLSWFFGLGGYRLGPLVIVLLLLPPAVFLGRSQVESKAVWLFTLTVLVFVLYTFVDSNSPPSRGVLNATLDQFDLPFFEEVERSTSGSSTCRPKCPQAERIWLTPSVAEDTAMGAAAGALVQAGYVDDANELFPRGEVPERLTLRRGNEEIQVETERRRRAGKAPQVFLKIRLVGSR